MSVIMTDEPDHVTAARVTFICHIKRQREDGEPNERALCGNRWEGFAVAEPGASLPHLLPIEFICETCAAAHVAGSV